MIVIDSEQMLVTNVPGGPAGCMNSPCTITVTRAYNNTTEAGHAINAAVLKQTPDTQITIQWGAGPAPVANNDVILIDSEQMLVTNTPGCGASPCTITVTRAYNHTTEATHAVNATVYKEGGDTTLSIKWAGGAAAPVANNDVIVIDSEQMLVTNVPGGPAGCMNSPCTITVTRAYNNTTEAGHAINAAVLKQTPDTQITIQWGAGPAPVANNDVILIDSEQMLVTNTQAAEHRPARSPSPVPTTTPPRPPTRSTPPSTRRAATPRSRSNGRAAPPRRSPTTT